MTKHILYVTETAIQLEQRDNISYASEDTPFKVIER